MESAPSSQDGGIGRNTLLPYTTERRITTNLKIINNQSCQNVKLQGILTTKGLKKHSSRWVGGVEMGSQSRVDTRQGCRPHGRGGVSDC